MRGGEIQDPENEVDLNASSYYVNFYYSRQLVSNTTGYAIYQAESEVSNSPLTHDTESECATVVHAYSTIALTITLATTNTNYDYNIWYYYYDSSGNMISGNSGINTLQISWTPTYNLTCYVHITQVWKISYNANGATGGSVSDQWKSYGTNLTLRSNTFTKEGYEANGWNKSPVYKASPDYADGVVYSGGSLTLYANFKPIQSSSNLLKYDETEKYYYFEDGYMPQTYAEMISSGLNEKITNNGTLVGTYSLENGTTYKLASYNNYGNYDYYLGFTATKDMTLDLEGYTPVNNAISPPDVDAETVVGYSWDLVGRVSGTYSFTQGTLYWFRFEPIRWRITDYGTTEIPEEWSYYGSYNANYTVVSDLVLWYDCLATESYIEGKSSYDMPFTTSLRDGNFETMLSTFTNAYTDGELLYSGSNSAEWQKFGEVGQASPVQVDTTHTTSDYELTKTNKYTSGNTSSLRVASTDEIFDTIGNTKAKASCLVAFLMGSSNTQYSKYWTRDLGNNLNAGKVVAKNGLTRSEWLSNSNGIRFAYTMSEGSNML